MYIISTCLSLALAALYCVALLIYRIKYNGLLRALVLAPQKHKKTYAAVKLNLFFLTSLLQCTSIYGCAL